MACSEPKPRIEVENHGKMIALREVGSRTDQ